MSRYLSALVIAVACSQAGAQTATGILEGVVTDTTGAAVPAAKVTIENQRTGVVTTQLTNAEGRYVQPYLIPSEYRLTVEKPGFQKNVTSDIKVDVQQTVAVNVSLRVGEITNTVEVTASSVQLATETSSISTVIDMKRILDLPLNGRNPFALATTAPGVIPGGGSTPWISGGRNA